MNPLSQSFKTENDFSVPLDFKSLPTVPKSHEWTKSAHHPIAPSESVPVIDLYDPNAMSLIRHAFEKWGVFQVINHGFPMNLLEEVESQSRQFFSLPIDRKVCALKTPEASIGYGLHRISLHFPKLLWSEGFTMSGSPMEHAKQLWPDQSDQITGFCTAMEEYQKESRKLSERIIEMMLVSLGSSPEDVEWFKPKTGSDKTQTMLTLNSYPACPDPERAMGLSPHTDSSLISILYQGSCNGLQIYGDGIGWMPAEVVPGALVVLVGDFLHILTNGRFKNPMHRALVNKTYHRISVVNFYVQPKDATVAPLTGLIDADHPPLFPPLTWKEHLDTKKYDAGFQHST